MAKFFKEERERCEEFWGNADNLTVVRDRE